MTTIEIITNIFMLCLTLGVFGCLFWLQKKTKKKKSEMYPYVLLMRSERETVPLGTYALQEHAVAALHSSVAKTAGFTDINMAADTVLSGFSNQGLTWKGKDEGGRKLMLWVAEIPTTVQK